MVVDFAAELAGGVADVADDGVGAVVVVAGAVVVAVVVVDALKSYAD